jgi:predicted glycosyltransferase
MSGVLLLSTHLSGSGHLARVAAIARATAAMGGAATVVNGGAAVPWIDRSGVGWRQLPPLHVRDLDFSTLLTPEGAPADAEYLGARREAVVGALRALRPDVLVCELYPFGRRALAQEFEAAISEALALGARVVCSVRDLPEPPRKPGRAERAEAALVAVGGGGLGRALLGAAVEAARLGRRRWRLRVGGPDAAAEAARLARAAAGAPVVVEPAAGDYRARLGACAASVSLFGYNTALDLAQTGAPSVVVPSDEGGEREQTLRAEAFARRSAQFEILRMAELSPPRLADAVERAAARGRAAPMTLDLGGAARSARILLGQE